jgi:hypothetical protein
MLKKIGCGALKSFDEYEENKKVLMQSGLLL